MPSGWARPSRCSPPRATSAPAETAASFGAADAALALVAARPGQVLLLYDELGLEKLLLSVPPALLRAFAERELGSLDPELAATVPPWLETDGSPEAVAGRAGITVGQARRRVARLVEAVADRCSVARLTDLYAATLAQEIVSALDGRPPHEHCASIPAQRQRAAGKGR